MTARLPVPGGDDNTWGDILNTFLDVEHNADGTLKQSGTIATAASNASTALTTAQSAVQTVNGKSGTSVTLAAADLGVLPAVDSVNVVRPEAYGAVGDGTNDDTTAVQTALNSGQHVYLDPSKTFNLTAQIVMNNANQVLFGGGLLSFTAGITNSPALLINVDGCLVQGLRMLNVNSLGSSSGNRSCGISAACNEVKIVACTVERFQGGIQVKSSGEYQNIVIANNRVKDVLGAGGGSSDPSSAGEDRGDGIVVWGCQATVIGNVVNCMAGRDARIGIHAEALDGGNVVQAPHTSALVTVTGNVVFGQFRRSIVFEKMTNCVASGNTVADATWWNLAMIGSSNCTMANNVVIYTRSSADLQGNAWSPSRGPIMIYSSCTGCNVIGNSVLSTGVGTAFIRFDDGGTGDYPVNTLISNNACYCAADESAHSAPIKGGINKGVNGLNSTGTRVLNNTFSGFTVGAVQCNSDTNFDIINNVFDGIDGTASGVLFTDSDSNGSVVSGNRIRNVSTGVTLAQQTGTQVHHNTFENCATGINFNTAASCDATDNQFVSVTNNYASLVASCRVDTGVVSQSANYAATVADNVILASGNITVTLPSASIVDTNWYQPTVKNVGSGTVTVATAGGNIQGSATISLSQGESVTLNSDSTNYW